MSDHETLVGGGVNEVVRIGDTVRRPIGSWSPQVHSLLQHLRGSGFTAAPSFHGITTDGHEILDYLPGEVCNYPVSPAAATTQALETAAQLLREYHDHTIDYAAAAPLDGWMLPAVAPVEVICHGDYGPHNVVLQGTRAVGIIDFDTAHPGSRLWDVAYAVYRWAPTTAPANEDGIGTVAEQALRARIFCDRYGLGSEERVNLVDAIITRLHSLVDFMKAQAAAGNEAFASHLKDGHHIQYLNDARYLSDNRREFSDAVAL